MSSGLVDYMAGTSPDGNRLSTFSIKIFIHFSEMSLPAKSGPRETSLRSYVPHFPRRVRQSSQPNHGLPDGRLPLFRYFFFMVGPPHKVDVAQRTKNCAHYNAVQ